MRRERVLPRFATAVAVIIAAYLGSRSFLERPEKAAASGTARPAVEAPVSRAPPPSEAIARSRRTQPAQPPRAVVREVFSGKVVGVSDGDTLSVLRTSDSGELRAVKVRLDGVDCPESAQAFGRRAKQMSRSLCYGKEVRVEVRDVDRYSRLVARVVLPDGRDLSKELVRAGLAWWYRQYSSDAELEALEAEAREAGRGLWVDEAAARTPPWTYRQASRTR